MVGPLDALDDAPTDPHLPVVVLPDDPGPTPYPPPRDDLPPGFGLEPEHRGPHPATTPALTTLTFRVRPEPWYRSNAAKLTLVVLGLLVAVVSIVILLWPSSTDAPSDSGATTPAPSPSASATPSTTTPSTPPRVELPPPPPPPPTSESTAPPVYYPPYYGPPQPTRKPRIDVTRTPISVSPTVKPKPGNR